MRGKRSLGSKMLIALISGIVFGLIAHGFFTSQTNSIVMKWILTPIGNIFLKGLMMIAVPLVLCSVICGVASIVDVKKLRRVSGKIMIYYIFTTAFAVASALIFASFVKPGSGLNLTLPSEFKIAEVPFIMDVLNNLIPSNPIEALLKGEMLQIMVFAIFVGIAIKKLGEPVEPLLNIFKQVNSTMLKTTDFVMLAAPYGVFALISRALVLQGIEVLLPLMKYTVTILIVLLFQLLLVYGLALKMFGKVSPVIFFKKYCPVMIAAFSTSNSNAVIPVNLDTCKSKLGASESISSLTIPLGASINLDGTAIMQGVAVIFIVQLLGINLTLTQLLMIILITTFASIGTAGVPGAGIAVLAMVLQQVGIPLEGIAVVLSVDRIINMFSTVVNAAGDAVGTVIVANSEKELDLEIYSE